MTQKLLIVAESGQDEQLSDVAAQICRAWSSPQNAPACVDIPFSDLDSMELSAGGCSAVVMLLQGDARTRCFKQIDRLRSLGLPGLLLVDSQESACGCSGGVLVKPVDTPPEQLAAMLEALLSRQEAVLELSRELQIVRKTSGGVREEIQKMSQEMSLAAKIQQELIPSVLPEIDRMEVGVLFRPASYVSGDIYNMAKIDDRRVAFFIADAVGHGVPAALLTMIISRSLPMRGGVSEGRIITPADALGRLNDELCDVSDGNPRFATAVYGIIDTSNGLVRIANGGHPQPMRIGAGGVRHVEAGGPLLGVFHGATFEEEHFELEPGETLLLYSDGFEVAFPNADAVLMANTPSPSRGYLDHLLKIGRWRQRGVRSMTEALADLERSLDSARGSLHQPDDVTALALSRAAA